MALIQSTRTGGAAATVDAFFRRQLAIYADHHRDPRNCVAHYVAIPLLFLAVILPLALWRVELAGINLSAASLLTGLAVVGWIVIDRLIGAAMIVAVAPLVALAEWIALRFGAVPAWSIAAGLVAIGSACLIVGHAVFEHRRPAFAGNLFQPYIGPMFVLAKAAVALGLRPDLAAVVNGGRRHSSTDVNTGAPAKLAGAQPAERRSRG